MNWLHRDPQEERALELEALGEHRRADAVRRCGARQPGYSPRTCKRRECPNCALRRSIVHARSIEADIMRMANPMVFLLTYPSGGLHDLGRDMREFRHALTKLKRSKRFAGVLSASGVLEPLLAKKKRNWALHAHLVLDVSNLDLAEVARIWKTLTGSHGTFAPDSRSPTPVSIRRLANYITKPNTWCPLPGVMDLWTYELLRIAIRGRRMLIRWRKKR